MKLLGPVFHKELLELSRRRSTYYLRALTATALLLVVLVYANDTGRFGKLSTARLQSAVGSNIFDHWMWYQFWIVCGAMPLLVCGLISAEREAGSLELLFTTHLTDREIVLGKLASRLFVTVLLVFSALPVLVIIGLLGGVDFERLGKISILTMSAALMVAAAGVYCSTVGKRPWVSCLQTYGAFVFLWVFVPFAFMVCVEVFVRGPGGGGGMPPRWCFFVLMAAAPYAGVAMLTEPRANAMVGWLADWSGIFTFAGIWVAIAGVFLMRSMLELRVLPPPHRVVRILTWPLAALLKKLFGRKSHVLSNRWKLRFPTLGLARRNPIVWRNRRAGVYDPGGHLFRLQVMAWLFTAGMLGLFGVMADRGLGVPVWFLLAIQTAFLHLMIAAVGASSIARERQRGSLDLVLLTNIPSAAMVVGTLQGVLWTCLPTIGLVAATLTAAVWVGNFAASFALEYGMVAVGYSAVILASSVFVSSGAVRASHAVTAAVIVVLIQWFLPSPIGIAYGVLTAASDPGRLDWSALVLAILAVVFISAFGFALVLGRGRPLAPAVVISVLTPMTLLLIVPGNFGGPVFAYYWRWATRVQPGYRMTAARWEGVHSEAIPIGLAYLLAAVLITLVAVWKFNPMMGRTSARPVQPARNPPLEGRNVPLDGSNEPTPTKAPSQVTATSRP